MGVAKNKISPEGSELKKLRVIGNGIFSSKETTKNLRETKIFIDWRGNEKTKQPLSQLTSLANARVPAKTIKYFDRFYFRP